MLDRKLLRDLWHILPQALAIAAVLAAGAGTVIVLHLAAARREDPRDKPADARGGFVEVCAASAIPNNGAVTVCAGGERVAVFRSGDRVSAVSNVCAHQNGPLGEGRIIDGCITCPWHGYQYLPETGASPPPFTEKVSVFRTEVRNGVVWVDPTPLPGGTRVEPGRA